MEFSRYQPEQPPAYEREIMSDIIMMQRYRYLKVQKPTQTCNLPLAKPDSSFKSFEIVVEPLKNELLKRKIIKKIKSERIDTKMEKRAQNLLNLHLLYKLNESTLEMAGKKIPPPFSILDTKEEGDYLGEDEKKQFPHFSNTLKPTQIPHCSGSSYLPKIPKMRKPPVFSIEQRCVFKIKQVYQFPKLLYKYGNEEFSQIAQQLMTSECNVKILYDLFNDYFDVEDSMDNRSDEQTRKLPKRIKYYLINTLNKYRQKKCGSNYVPFEEEFVSLKQIRMCLNARRQESSSSSEEDD